MHLPTFSRTALRISAASALAAAGCASTAQPTGGVSGPASPGASAPSPLAATIEAPPPGPVAIVPGAESGLCAVFADRTEDCFVADHTDWVLVDHRAQVIWFGATGEIRVLDMLRPEPTPELLVTGLPEDVMPLGPPGIAVAYGPSEGERLFATHPGYPLVVVDLATQTLRSESRIFPAEAFEPAVAALSASLSEASRARLRAFAERGAGRQLFAASPQKVAPVALPPQDEPCEGEVCGEAWTIPGSPLLRVATSWSCGDGCHVGWDLYDPRTKSFLAAEWASLVPLSRATVSPDGGAIVADGMVVSLDEGPLCESRGQGGGWLRPGAFLP